MEDKDKICVSIFMLTYNQEEYISQAIEGVLMQETTFPVELVIGDDCSTDGTVDICRHYRDRYPEMIKLFLNKKNVGIGRNYIKTLAQCTGKYVAICDGDDFWIDKLKLQKQVGFLENNPDFNIVFTNNFNLFPSGESHERDISKIPKISSFEDLVKGNYIASVTAVFRNKVLPVSMKQWMEELPYGDWPSYLWIIKDNEKIMFLDDVTAVYRKGLGTSTHLRKEKFRIGEVNLFILKNFRLEVDSPKYRDLVDQNVTRLELGLLTSYNREKKFLESLKMMKKLRPKVSAYRIFRSYLYSLKRTFLS